MIDRAGIVSLFGCEVIPCSQCVSEFRSAAALTFRSYQAEVQDPHNTIAAEYQIRRLDVSMNEATRM
jgi:hypothetical protein